jgi:hypothetical protein
MSVESSRMPWSMSKKFRANFAGWQCVDFFDNAVMAAAGNFQKLVQLLLLVVQDYYNTCRIANHL